MLIELMRPLPMEAMPGAPSCVGGVSIVRGAPLPVVIVSRLFEGAEDQPERLVVVHTGSHRIGLAVDAVLGFRSLAEAKFAALPPLLSAASAAAVAAIGAVDGEFLRLLGTAGLIPDGIFAALEQAVPS
jgi:purine-binding chemotaxis protein CheW